MGLQWARTDRPNSLRSTAYDALNDLKVGAFAGLAVGANVAAVTRVVWILPVGVIAGAVIGYLWERSRVREDLDALPPVDEERK